MGLAGGIDGYIANKRIFADRHDIDALDVAARFPDRRRDLAKFAGGVLYLDPTRQAIAGIGCRSCGNNLKEKYG